ncbi:hypothetical protein OQA88_8990 [Cercophora sp. LCS_1]
MGLRSAAGTVTDREGWVRLGQFFSKRSWWHRVWTVQEYIPDVKKVFMCGVYPFPSDLILITLRLMMLLEVEPGFEFLQSAGFHVAVRTETFRMAFYARSAPALTVYYVLKQRRNRAATDPRDKVFAPLGLVPADQRSDPALSINYSLSVEEVFTNVAEYLLRTTGRLD